MTEQSLHAGQDPVALTRTPWRAVVLFAVLASGLAWLVALPLWLMDPAHSLYGVAVTLTASVMMFTPAVAVLIVMIAMRVPPRGSRLRFLGMWPLRPARRVVWFIVASMFAPLLLVLASLAVAVAFGWVTLDLVHFSGFQAVLDAQLAGVPPELAEVSAAAMPPIAMLVVLQIASIPLGALINSIFAFGEELGWRGWLLPALRPLGVWPALLLSGVLWGLWHSPLILLGYNFNRLDLSGVLLMTVGCVMWGIFFGWLRLRSGSVWPAVVGHGALNASAGVFALLAAAGAPIDMSLVNPLGVSGWVVLALIAVGLVLTGQFKREPGLAPSRPKRYPPAGYGPPNEPPAHQPPTH